MKYSGKKYAQNTKTLTKTHAPLLMTTKSCFCAALKMNEELIQNLVSAAESLSRSVDRAEEKLKTQKENNAKLQQLVFFLDSVAKRKERQVRETEVRVAKRKLRTSTMEMEMETKKREEKVREIELRAWLERDDRKFEQLKEKKRKALEKTTTDSSVTSALNALFERREEEDQEDQEEERENSKRRKEKECEETDQMWLQKAREKVQQELAKFRVEFLERES